MMTKDSERLELPRDEMAFRAIYKHLLISRQLTVVWRPGGRNCGQWRGYCPGETVTARVISRVGADWAKLAPEFEEDFAQAIQIEEIDVIRLSDLSSFHFVGSSPEIVSVETLVFHLGVIYNRTLAEIADADEITRVRFSYL